MVFLSVTQGISAMPLYTKRGHALEELAHRWSIAYTRFLRNDHVIRITTRAMRDQFRADSYEVYEVILCLARYYHSGGVINNLKQDSR